MEILYATISSKGQLVIPSELRQSMGIVPGTRVAIRLEGDELILRPATKVTARRLISELVGMTAGGPSMTEQLIADRRAEDEKAGW
jgi:AbrB family looped-hinge helix DNA binding protein